MTETELASETLYLFIKNGDDAWSMVCAEVKWSEVSKRSEAEWREGHDEMWMHQFMTLRISLLLLFSV
jgi:hypothetical protein